MKNIKKQLFAIGCIATLITGVNNVNALTANADGSYTNNQKIQISQEQYAQLKRDEWNDQDIDKMSKEMIEGIISRKYEIGSQTKNIVTTTTYNKYGVPINIKEVEVTEEEGEKLIGNDECHILSDGKLHDLKTENIAIPYSEINTYETTYKKLTIQYTREGNGYKIHLTNKWKKTPQVKGYDVIGIRYEYNKNSNSVTVSGHQRTNNSNYQFYSQDSGNMKKFLNGVGLVQNLFDNSSTFTNELIATSDTTFGFTVYGSYQHAQSSSLTKEQALSFGIAADGLGEVIKYSQNISSKYDGMTGVKTYTPEFEY